MTPSARERLRKQLIRHEGLRLFPYRDSVGKLTIGVGRNLDDVGLSFVECGLLLDHDITQAVIGCAQTWPQWFLRLDEVRQAAIVNIVFNMGLTRFRGFTRALVALDTGDFETAAAELLASRWARQVGTRARELAEQVRTGEWAPE